MLAAPLDIFGLIIREKRVAYRVSATCKQLRAQVRGLYSISKKGSTVTITGPYKKWNYAEIDFGFWVPTYLKATPVEDIVYDSEHECQSCVRLTDEPHIDIGGALVHVHDLAFAVRGGAITIFDANRITNFTHAAQIYGPVYEVARVEHSYRDPGGLYLGMDGGQLNVRGGDYWKIVLERAYLNNW